MLSPDEQILDCVRIREDLFEQLREMNPSAIDANRAAILREIAQQNARIAELELEQEQQ